MPQCDCHLTHTQRRIVLTGGPGAGKTALLELIRHSFCSHVMVLPEAAGIIFGGGFPRTADPVHRRAAQVAIFHVQRQLEAIAGAHDAALVLCDRGTIDALAYWPGAPEEFWASVQSTFEAELARYDVVIHLRTPTPAEGYNHKNPLRTESPAQAAEIDERIALAWAPHPRRFLVPSSANFLDKAARALQILYDEIPPCCRAHVIPAFLDTRVEPHELPGVHA